MLEYFSWFFTVQGNSFCNKKTKLTNRNYIPCFSTVCVFPHFVVNYIYFLFLYHASIVCSMYFHS